MTHASDFLPGIELSPSALIRLRPDRAVTGFAPGGRVRTHLWGANRSVFFGRGMEYAESRTYQPGDDLKTIDWRLTARSTDVHTKMFHEERERPVFILLDLRTMMRFGTRKRFKSCLAGELAALLAWVGHDGGDRVGGFVLTASGVTEFPAARTRTALLTFLHAISDASRMPGPEDAPTTDEPALHLALRKMRHVCRPGTLAFVISDFSDREAQMQTEIQRLARRAHVTLLFVSDPMETRLPDKGGRLSDGSRLLAVDRIGKAGRMGHTAAFQARREMLETLTRKRGLAFVPVSTLDEPTSILRPRGTARPGHSQARGAA
ncbi:DUF58 domain-containing protein [Pseudoruegeria sp. SK021]|uniref:DUF58 domain-containing protein n=1 Tax=Pseudoruegeria sp. SK021 TaxID=1933035 RepID=UPI000A2185D1|nr:DUF58 domain-containing protein [Pseudoruegeria sp. SK021]OSP55974.1 hypothetical protein BV911_04820 [Pseudoruegeria sp. SK021]